VGFSLIIFSSLSTSLQELAKEILTHQTWG